MKNYKYLWVQKCMFKLCFFFIYVHFYSSIYYWSLKRVCNISETYLPSNNNILPDIHLNNNCNKIYLWRCEYSNNIIQLRRIRIFPTCNQLVTNQYNIQHIIIYITWLTITLIRSLSSKAFFFSHIRVCSSRPIMSLIFFCFIDFILFFLYTRAWKIRRIASKETHKCVYFFYRLQRWRWKKKTLHKLPWEKSQELAVTVCILL